MKEFEGNVHPRHVAVTHPHDRDRVTEVCISRVVIPGLDR